MYTWFSNILVTQRLVDAMKTWEENEFWKNTTWYHATQAGFAKSIINNGVIANINNNKPLDFGYGFYLTPNKEWARNYLIEQISVLGDTVGTNEKDGYVLEFSFCPQEYLEKITYKFFKNWISNYIELQRENYLNVY